MKLAARTALGIDISQGQINLALLKKCASGIKLLKAASGPVPPGVIENGNIEQPASLAKAVNKLRAKSRIGMHHQSVMSLVARPVLIQILDLPENVPANIGEFVRREVKHCAMLPAGKVTSDFCGLKPRRESPGRRVLVTAVGTQKLTESAAAIEAKGLNVVAIEPATLALLRVYYQKRVAKKLDRNLLLVVVHQDVLALYLFRNETLSFVTTKQFESNDSNCDKCLERLIEEISAVIQFYDFEVLKTRCKWEVEIIADELGSLPREKVNVLPVTNNTVDLKIRTFKEASVEAPLINSDSATNASAVAIGLAMRLLQPQDFTPTVNLFPTELLQAKSVKKQSWVIANVAAAALFLMVLSIGVLNAKLGKLNSNKDWNTRAKAVDKMRTLLHERTSLDEQVKEASARLSSMSSAVRDDYFMRWDRVLTQIAHAVPKSVRIRGLSSDDSSVIAIEGQAVSYEAIELFLNMLSNCEYIESASLAKTEIDDESDKWIRYSIGCLLTDRKEYQ